MEDIEISKCMRRLSRSACLPARRMGSAGLHVWQGSVLHDIDEPADLSHLPAGNWQLV
jgi:hypothetical protein